MKAVGVIVEYNPLHNGHVHHLNESRRLSGADAVVAVMSGPFLQRGEPAIVGKRARAEMALHAGADLVLELPVAYAVQPAEWFAFGAVSLLHRTGVVDSLCFGSESGDIDSLQRIARVLAVEPAGLREDIARRLREGASYPAAYAGAAAALAPGGVDADDAAALLEQPNNSLGLHYLIALQRLGSAIRPLTAARTGAAYHQATPGPGAIASATAVRRLLLADGPNAAAPYVPAASLAILQREWQEGRAPIHWERFAQPLLHIAATRRACELERIAEVTEGLEHRLLRALAQLKEPSVEALLNALKTKRYTRTKLQRMLTHLLLNHTKHECSPEQLAAGPGYLRVLGFTSTGQHLLKQMKKTASLPVVVKPSTFTHHQLELDIQAQAAYALAYGQADSHGISRAMYSDYYESPVRI
ncbi:nucleotidyltransferase [Paenibacillus silvae]|uniref:nucleotidyltransferase n=1 Tax=Paenibacillus silvae TaxID=1325358 RepID=UPI002003BA5E|nr:nucleotidyltransferase [Paenibacillus silvae]MCK6074096.1 nucleotidyltransferase [Paenibacillus silvae]MCK6148426.1 nucleotidyltransferase [Paenibacillus silvae]MCK6266726.1 nucleotidyltransferase [Paenibacillus silvae]